MAAVVLDVGIITFGVHVGQIVALYKEDTSDLESIKLQSFAIRITALATGSMVNLHIKYNKVSVQEVVLVHSSVQ